MDAISWTLFGVVLTLLVLTIAIEARMLRVHKKLGREEETHEAGK